ncbi:MAG TPA: SH3 domain-containing protein [Thermoanaerobaculaceae bacterium]|nr:SH3 domain-containing protein [Thermoanaerobaculaceae bacterium]
MTRPNTPLQPLAALLVAASACQTAAPPPAPAPVPVEVQPAPEEKPAPPQVFVRVTGSRLNVREGPGVDTAAIAKAKKGERLAVVGQDGDWYQVRVGTDRTGWVLGKFVTRDEPCGPDKATAEILNAPPLTFTEGKSLGRVVLEATVASSGSVIATKVVQDTTGDAALEKQAEGELRALRFAPPVRKCRPLPFIYTFTRNF